MAVLGVIFIVIALGIAAAAVFVATSAGASPPSVGVFNDQFQLSLTPLAMFLLGVAATLLLLLGFWMMTSAGKRRVRRSQERRALEKQQREQEKELAATRAKLATTAPERVEQTERTERIGHTGGVTERSSTSERVVREEDTATGPRPDGTFDDGRRP